MDVTTRIVTLFFRRNFIGTPSELILMICSRSRLSSLINLIIMPDIGYPHYVNATYPPQPRVASLPPNIRQPRSSSHFGMAVIVRLVLQRIENFVLNLPTTTTDTHRHLSTDNRWAKMESPVPLYALPSLFTRQKPRILRPRPLDATPAYARGACMYAYWLQ